MKRSGVFLLILLGVGIVSCTQRGEELPPTLEPVRLTMGFRPDVQFAPMYVTVEQSYDEEVGLNIEFSHIPETEAVQLVGVNELQFAIVSGEQVLLARAQELPVVYVFAWFQDYPVAVAAPIGSGIHDPADLVGKRVGIPGLFGASYIGFRALLDAAGVDESTVTLDSIGYTQVEALYEGVEDAVVVYANNEPLQLEVLGTPVNVIRVADYVNLASNGLITNEETIRDNPDLVRRMVLAFSRGLEDTINDPDKAFDISKKYVEGLAEADQIVQRGILATSIEFWKTDPLGFSSPDSWENMQQVLLDMGLLTTSLDLEASVTNAFLPAP